MLFEEETIKMGLSVHPSIHLSVDTRVLCEHNSLQFTSDPFEIVQMFFLHAVKMSMLFEHNVIFFPFFPTWEESD